ncbi:MAG: SCO family protein [Burkholderiales bacterium]
MNDDAKPEVTNTKRALLGLMGVTAIGSLLVASQRELRAAPGPRADYFPNSVVYDHNGHKLRFYDDVVRGKVLAFNMMYTACAGICPRSTANLKTVQGALAGHVGKEIFMYSMTLRPELDSPKELRAYMDLYEIPTDKGWTFLTGKPAEMDLIRRKLGFYNSDPVRDADISQHTGMVRMGNEALDRWTMSPAMGSHKQIARELLHLRA